MEKTTPSFFPRDEKILSQKLMIFSTCIDKDVLHAFFVCTKLWAFCSSRDRSPFDFMGIHRNKLWKHSESRCSDEAPKTPIGVR